jgi:hypothetical protein
LVTDQIGASVLCPFFVPTGITESQRNRPQALAATERAGDLERRPVTKCKPRQRGVSFVCSQLRIQAAQVFQDTCRFIQQADMLVEHGDAVGEAADIAARGFHRAHDQTQQGGFAGAVGAADDDPLGAADLA